MLAVNFPEASVDTPGITRTIFPTNFEDEFIFPKSEGDFVSSGINEDAELFQSTIDGPPVVRTFDNFTVKQGHAVRPSHRCKGFYLNILGDLTIDGLLSMNRRGANAQGKFVGVFPDYERIFYCAAPTDYDIVDEKIEKFIIGAVGGSGGSRASMSTWATNGKAGINNAGGGGGSGAAGGNIAAGCNNGSAGTSFSGGSGGGGIVHSGGNPGVTAHATAYGGPGGASYQNNGSYTTSTGVGNPAGTRRIIAGTSYVSTEGTGGAIIIFVHGNIKISNLVTSGATAGIYAAGTGATSASNPGGGSGGGLIHLFCHGTFENNGTINVAGGGNGGAGSKTVWQKKNGIWTKLAA